MMIFMPNLYRLLILYWLRILNFTRWSLKVFDTLKKNHCEQPFVLISFCSSKLYYPSRTLETIDRLPHQKRDSKIKVRSLGPEGLQNGNTDDVYPPLSFAVGGSSADFRLDILEISQAQIFQFYSTLSIFLQLYSSYFLYTTWSNASPIQLNMQSFSALAKGMGRSRGWKLGIRPTKAGRGSIGVRDFGLWLTGLGRSMSGGGMRCLETRISKDSSWSVGESLGSGELSLLGLSSSMLIKYVKIIENNQAFYHSANPFPIFPQTKTKGAISILFAVLFRSLRLIIVLDRMNKQPSAVMMMGMLMSRTSLEIGIVLELVQALNRSYFQCQRVVTILEQVFAKQKSGKILLGVEVLQFLIKNCNKNFHQAANKESFQRRLLGLLKRLRGKTNFLSDLRSNSDNWNRIEAKVLYLIQLWYDAFILEESVYDNIIDNYKVLRKENVLFPPRSVNEKNIIFVKTESPILQNIQEIARADQQKFGKRLENMGMTEAVEKLERFEAVEQQKRQHHRIDLDEMSEKIAIVRSNGYEGSEMIRLIESVRKDLEFGKVDPSEEKYWKDIKEAAELLIQEWQQKNVEIIREHERKYLEAKMGKVAPEKQQKEEVRPIVQLQKERPEEKPQRKPQQKREEINLLDL